MKVYGKVGLAVNRVNDQRDEKRTDNIYLSAKTLVKTATTKMTASQHKM